MPSRAWPRLRSNRWRAGWDITALSDRYFRGPSGRGFVTGNPDLEPERRLDIDWKELEGERFMVRLVLEATDRRALYADLAAAVSATDTDIRSFELASSDGHVTGALAVEVENRRFHLLDAFGNSALELGLRVHRVSWIQSLSARTMPKGLADVDERKVDYRVLQ